MFANIKYQKFIKYFIEEFPNKTLEDAKTEWIKFRSAEILAMTEYGNDEVSLARQEIYRINFYNKYHWFYKTKRFESR